MQEFLTTVGQLIVEYWRNFVMFGIGGADLPCGKERVRTHLAIAHRFCRHPYQHSRLVGRGEHGFLTVLYNAGIENELFSILISSQGAMIDFAPLLSRPFMLFFGAAAQFGIFATLMAALAWASSASMPASYPLSPSSRRRRSHHRRCGRTNVHIRGAAVRPGIAGSHHGGSNVRRWSR